jgi:cytochrome P450
MHAGIAMKYLKPLIKDRVENMTKKREDPSFDFEEPVSYIPRSSMHNTHIPFVQNDFITWMVRESLKRDTEDERSVYALAYRIVLLNFAAITTSTIMATNALLDIWSTPNAEELVSKLRDEAEGVFREFDGHWTKAALAKLIHLDSAIRESARVSGVGGTALARRVRADDGITLPDGTWIPKNSTVGVSMDGIHFDEEFYDNPREFRPFRFVRPQDGEKRPNEDLVTTSPHWLPFSHGMHAW